jgi:hypothetical protein
MIRYLSNNHIIYTYFISIRKLETLIKIYKLNNNMDEFLNLIDFYDWVDINESVPKKYVRDMQNPIDYYNDKEFLNRFRFVA